MEQADITALINRLRAAELILDRVEGEEAGAALQVVRDARFALEAGLLVSD